jgi:phospholipid/cholesterol/gamma-HCH transport system substrate-binding protein
VFDTAQRNFAGAIIMNNKAYPNAYRYMSESVGAFFLLTLIIVGITLFQTGKMRHWLEASEPLRVRLPKEGLFGLAPGAAVEILGIQAGTVEDIEIGSDLQIHANIYIRGELARFVTLNSKAIIRKRFGIAGDAYLEITRGTGPPLDLEGGIIHASADKAATDTLVEVVEDIRKKIIPALEQSRRGFSAWADVGENLSSPDGNFSKFIASGQAITEQIENGEGVIGQLLTDKKLADELRQMLNDLRTDLARVGPIMDDTEIIFKDMKTVSDKFAESSKKLPPIIDQTGETLASLKSTIDRSGKLLEPLESVIVNINKMMPHLTKIAKNTESTMKDMPLLVQQTQQTLHELQVLLKQMQRNWLVAGMKGPDTKQTKDITPERVLP